MRFFTLLLITLFVTSCGNQKLRFVRTERVKQQIVELEDVSTDTRKRTESLATEIPERSETSEVIESTTAETSDQSDEEKELISPTNELETADFPSVEEDSTNLTSEEVASIQDEALRSEKQGRWSFVFSILTYVFLALGVVTLFILSNLVFFYSSPYTILWTVVSILFGVLYLGSLITSITLGIKSLRARYTTRRGKKLAIAGLVLSGIIVLFWLMSLVLSL